MEMPRLTPSLTAYGLKYNPQSANKALENFASFPQPFGKPFC